MANNQSSATVTDIYKNIPVAFYFEVEVDGLGNIPFKEVSGLTSEVEVETIHEGGVNSFEFKLPKQVKHGNLVLKRAMILWDNSFISWIRDTLQNDFSQPIKTKNITISLLNRDKKPVYSWICTKAYPVKWESEALDAEKNSILIESVEFAYYEIYRFPQI